MISQISAQRSDFVDYLLELQYSADPIHRQMTDFFAASRATLSSELTALNDEAVHEITEGLRAVIAIRDRTEDSIAGISTPGNEQCITDATSNWAADLQAVGAGIQACADAHVDPIYERTEDFHIYLQEHNKLAFDTQNMVLNIFTDVSDVTFFQIKPKFLIWQNFQLNPLTDANQITPTVEARINEVYDEFENTIIVEVERQLVQINNLRLSVPGEVHTCVGVAIGRWVLIRLVSSGFLYDFYF